MRTNEKNAFVAVALAVLGLAVAAAASACGSSESGQTVQPKAAHAAGMPFRSAGKATAPLDMEHVMHGKAAPGESVDVELHFRPRQAVSRLRLQLSPEPGLELAGPRTVTTGPLEAGQEYVQRVTLTVTDDGLRYVNVIALVEHDGEQRVRTFAVPVRSGDGRRRKAAGEVLEDAAGERVVSLPAVERLR